MRKPKKKKEVGVNKVRRKNLLNVKGFNVTLVHRMFIEDMMGGFSPFVDKNILIKLNDILSVLMKNLYINNIIYIFTCCIFHIYPSES